MASKKLFSVLASSICLLVVRGQECRLISCYQDFTGSGLTHDRAVEITRKETYLRQLPWDTVQSVRKVSTDLLERTDNVCGCRNLASAFDNDTETETTTRFDFANEAAAFDYGDDGDATTTVATLTEYDDDALVSDENHTAPVLPPPAEPVRFFLPTQVVTGLTGIGGSSSSSSNSGSSTTGSGGTTTTTYYNNLPAQALTAFLMFLFYVIAFPNPFGIGLGRKKRQAEERQSDVLPLQVPLQTSVVQELFDEDERAQVVTKNLEVVSFLSPMKEFEDCFVTSVIYKKKGADGADAFNFKTRLYLLENSLCENASECTKMQSALDAAMQRSALVTAEKEVKVQPKLQCTVTGHAC